jgi:hypothetical protein
MWHCPNCGEQNEDQFDSCWRCTKTDPDEGGKLAQPRESWWFFRYWRRGWAILLLAVLVGLCARFASAALSATKAYEITVQVLVLVLVVLALPASAYLVFTLFFGEEAWTWGKKARTPSREETASALFEEGARLEACGNPEGALESYAEVVQDYAETVAAQQARKRLETLHAQNP